MRFVVVTLLAAILWCGQVRAPGNSDYSVKEVGNALEIETPWGKKVFYGTEALNATRNYKVEIPLSTFRPPPPPEPPPAPPAPPRAPKSARADAEDGDEDSEGESPAEPKLKKKLAQAIPSLPEKIVVEYDDSDRLVLEANRLYNRGKYFEATSYVDELLRKKPEYARGWIMKGSLMFVQNQKDLAKKAWERALELDPQNTEIKTMLDKVK